MAVAMKFHHVLTPIARYPSIASNCQELRRRSILGGIQGVEDLSSRSRRNIVPCQTPTNFSIERILRPEFGARRKRAPCDEGVVGEEKEEEVKTRCGVRDDGDSRADDSRLKGEVTREVKMTGGMQIPAWVYCTRYSDRPSAGRRSRKSKSWKQEVTRPRTAFSPCQLERMRIEFESDRYLNEERRKRLSRELQLSDAQIKIWFQNKRAKLKKSSRTRNALADRLEAEGLYNHKSRKTDCT